MRVSQNDIVLSIRRIHGPPVQVPAALEGALRETFGSACHGAGRVLSRSASKKGTTAKEIQKELESRGIIVQSLTREGLTEERPEAYKDIEAVVDVVHYGRPLAAALAAPHVSVRALDGVVEVEPDLLEVAGDAAPLTLSDFGPAAGITRTAAGSTAAVDPRFDAGVAAA